MCVSVIALAISLVLLLLVITTQPVAEHFGWSCTFTPSKYPKVDMGTVRDSIIENGDFY